MFGISWYECFLFLHVLAAIAFLGPVTIATSLFPKYATVDDLNVARAMHRIARGYGWASLAVPVFGLLTANEVNYLDAGWVSASLTIFIGAGAILLWFIVPGQATFIRQLEAGTAPDGSDLGPLRGMSGLYALSWLVILFLMVAKPF